MNLTRNVVLTRQALGIKAVKLLLQTIFTRFSGINRTAYNLLITHFSPLPNNFRSCSDHKRLISENTMSCNKISREKSPVTIAFFIFGLRLFNFKSRRTYAFDNLFLLMYQSVRPKSLIPFS